jgi:hypothetical protein
MDTVPETEIPVQIEASVETEASVEAPVEVETSVEAPVEALPDLPGLPEPVQALPELPEAPVQAKPEQPEQPELLETWSSATGSMRKTATEALQARGIWPSEAMKARDEMAGVYPDPEDPTFASRLYQKREFYESRAIAADVANGTLDPCTSMKAEAVFELTPVQRLVSRFMHPLTPYLGLLLFHGVGVGKTCSAVTIAEQFLDTTPNKVIVLVPQAIQENFKKTIFDVSKLKWSEESKEWTTNQCTGTSYLERLGLMNNPDLKAISFAVDSDRRKRYTITGYQAFANWIKKSLADHVPAGLDGQERILAENEILRKLFSEHLIIIDEAHNLRDVGDNDSVGGEAGENAGGKALNPYLKRIALNAEGLRIVLMTATPMYNSAPEILRLLNILIMNDTKTEEHNLLASSIFGPTGEITNPTALESAARKYVSYMRGENPYTFPLRLKSDSVAQDWPTVSATKTPLVLTDFDRIALGVLPLVFTQPIPGSPVDSALRGATMRTASGEDGSEGENDVMLDLRMQMANITYPDGSYGTEGWNTHFKAVEARTATRKIRVFSLKDSSNPIVFTENTAPKIKKIVDSITRARGICFAYSRYIKAGALPLAIALERAGFQRKLSDGKVAPILTGLPPVAPICAICSQTNAGHESTHEFAPAYYILLTSEDEISPDFPGLVRMATTWTDPIWGPLGTSVKAIIGSQVASEGLDLKCVREMHILDSWYHLNRTDQIIGRAIRYCSHSALRVTERSLGVPPMSYNNCTIYMHVTLIPGLETADMYAYRLAIRKARLVGLVQRLLKKNAWDCNLEMEAIIFTSLPPRVQIDAQGRTLPEYSANDQDYTTYCDYQVCKHECAISLPAELELDTSTYVASDARRIIMAKLDIVRHLFDDQVIVPETMIHEIFRDLPWEIRSDALLELIDGKRFKIHRGPVEGYLIKRAGYLVFQPAGVHTEIPMALRYARAFQLNRKFLFLDKPVFSKVQAPASASTSASASAGGGAGTGTGAGPGPEPEINSALMQRWTDWLAFVDGGPLPTEIPSTLKIWTWLRDHFTVPETRTVALRWWFDKMITYDEQKNLLETALKGNAELEQVLRGEIIKSSSLTAYRIYNPETLKPEYKCRQGNQFGPCNSMVEALVEKALYKPATKMGSLVGILSPKVVNKESKNKLIFKTMDLTNPKSKPGGAECGNNSTMGDHRPRVILLHEGAMSDDMLRPLIISHGEPWDEAGSKKRGLKPEHIKDFSHQPLCMYMEFLTRLLDARKVGEVRWFVGAIDALKK